MPTTTSTTVYDVRESLDRLGEWLDDHPDIPVASVYLDSADAELSLSPGGDMVAMAADVADALTGATIAVSDPPGKRMSRLRIAGTVPGDSRDRPGVDLFVSTSIYGDARARLLASLGAPLDPDVRSWDVTVEHLRGLVERAGTPVGAR